MVFLVSYVDCDRTRFNEVTVTYRDHITDAAPENYVCIGQPRNIPIIGQYLKCIEMDYECGGAVLYDLFIIFLLVWLNKCDKGWFPPETNALPEKRCYLQ